MMKKCLISLLLALCMAMGSLTSTVFASETALQVPEEGLVIKNGVYYGISKDWFTENNPDKKAIDLSVKIPSNVTTIAKDGFRNDNATEKKSNGAVTSDDNLGSYHIIKLDFSEASSLTTIGEQAAISCPVEGVLDLSNTKVATIGKNAFKECKGITGVILPSTLENIGSTDSGSVFYGCSNMQFIRTAGGNPAAAFELPGNLEVIGNQSFYQCNGLPAGTTVTIPATVTYVGSEAFYETDSITTIIVKTNDAGQYHERSFTAKSFGLGNRITVFNNSAAKNTFTPSGLSSYKNSLTYEFTLHYGRAQTSPTEKKLYGQPVNVCKKDDGTWAVNETYQFPEISPEEVRIGYDYGWEYANKALTTETVLKPNGDDLYLNIDYTLQDPVIAFIVDGAVIETDNTYPELTLSNDQEHRIGVQVTHPIQTVASADVKVKFEYKWTDVSHNELCQAVEGPRMSEGGFGADSWGKPKGINTITINGETHDRTRRKYSNDDYRKGYYLLEVYGYSRPAAGGPWTLFYKSANTGIGVSDPERTVNTAYRFDVITSAPEEKPENPVSPPTGNPDTGVTSPATADTSRMALWSALALLAAALLAAAGGHQKKNRAE